MGYWANLCRQLCDLNSFASNLMWEALTMTAKTKVHLDFTCKCCAAKVQLAEIMLETTTGNAYPGTSNLIREG